MRVLWFSNIPFEAAARQFNVQHQGIGGWIESLLLEIKKRPEAEMGFAFIANVKALDKKVVDGVHCYAIPSLRGRNKAIRFIRNISHRLEPSRVLAYDMEVVNDFRPDIIQIFGTESIHGLLIPRLRIPVIIHLQGNIIACRLKFFSDVSVGDVILRGRLFGHLVGRSLLHSYFRMKYQADREREIFRRCCYFVGRTRWDSRLVRVLSPSASYYHCDELMRPTFQNNIWKNRQNERFVLISTIRPHTYKGLATLIEGAKLFAISHGMQVEVRIAGISTSDEIVKICAAHISKASDAVELKFLGHLCENDLVGQMLDASVFVHPSHIDNSPNSVCEAQMLGMPVIATYAGGVPSLIEDFEDGLLFQDGDPYALAGCISELFNNTELAVRLGKKARKKAMIRHDPEKVATTLLNIYADVLAKESTSLP